MLDGSSLLATLCCRQESTRRLSLPPLTIFLSALSPSTDTRSLPSSQPVSWRQVRRESCAITRTCSLPMLEYRTSSESRLRDAFKRSNAVGGSREKLTLSSLSEGMKAASLITSSPLLPSRQRRRERDVSPRAHTEMSFTMDLITVVIALESTRRPAACLLSPVSSQPVTHTHRSKRVKVTSCDSQVSRTLTYGASGTRAPGLVRQKYHENNHRNSTK